MIFGERPLGKVLIALLCGFSLFASFPLYVKLGCLSVGTLLFLLSFHPKIREKVQKWRLPLLFTVIGILLSGCYFDLYFPASRYFAGEQTVTATVVDVDDTLPYKRSFTLKTSEIGATKCAYRLKADLYDGQAEIADGSFTAADIHVGDTLVFAGTLNTFGKSSDGFDFNEYYLSRGISAEADVTAIYTRTEGKKIPLAYRFKLYRLSLCGVIEERAGEEAGGFLSAVLLGERSKMSESLEHDFERVGISHLLALSGMHLAILTGILSKILSLCRVGKKWRYASLVLFAALFSALTGFPNSVVRSAVMISIACLLFLFGYPHDALTSLTIAVTLILCFSPYAARSIGLWLSAFSCFGIIFGGLLMEKDEEEREAKLREKAKNGEKTHGRIIKLLISVRNVLLISFFAILGTAMLQSTAFGKTSLLGAAATPAYSLLLEGYLFLGTLLLCFGGFLPLGKPLRLFYYLIRETCEKLSDLSMISVSTTSALCVAVGILIVAAFLCFLFVRARKPSRVIALFVLLTLAFYASAFVSTDLRRKRETVVYARYGQNEYLTVSTKGKTAVIDLSAQNVTSAYDLSAFLNAEMICEIDVYVFSGYSSATPSSVGKLLSDLTVRTVVIPIPKSDGEREVYEKLLPVLAQYRCEIGFFEEYQNLDLGSYSLMEIYRDPLEEGKRKILTLMDEDRVCTYLSAGVFEGDGKTAAEPLIGVSDTLIFGCRGSEYEYGHILKEEMPALRRLVVCDPKIAVGDALLGQCEVFYAPERFEIR